MPIVVNVDVMLAKRKMRLNELAERTGITQPNLSILKTGKARAIRFSTLDAICRALDCQPGDILEYQGDGTSETARSNVAVRPPNEAE
jgi:putative transcriptional regulator